MIRKYRQEDEDEIVKTWYAASSLAHPFLSATFMEKEEKNIRDIYLPNTKTWVFEEAGFLVGFISMINNEVGAIFVKPAYHGKGIGWQLMNTVAMFYEILEVEVFTENSIGKAFYLRYGFEYTGEYIHQETDEKIWRLRYSRKVG